MFYRTSSPLGPLPKNRPESAGMGPPWSSGGMVGWMEGRMEGWSDVSKFPHVLQDIGSLGPLPKKRKFWLVDPPKTTRLSQAPTNSSILFSLLEKTESRMTTTKACHEVVKELVSPVYDPAE